MSEIFKEADIDGKNVYENWMEKNKELLKKNVARSENQEEVAKHFGCLKRFNETLEMEGKKAGRVLSALEKYRILVREVHRHRAKKLKRGQVGDALDVIGGMIEGNNRVWTLNHCLFNAKLDEKAGVIREDSLTAESMIPHLLEFADRNANDVTENLENATGTTGEWIEERVQDDDSLFSRNTEWEVYLPIAKEKFMEKNMTIEEVQRVVIRKSHALMLIKKQCADMPIRNLMANELYQVIAEIEKNEKLYVSEFYPTFSANGGNYVESEPINKTIKPPKIDGKKDPTWTKPCVNVCNLWTTPQYLALEAETTILNLQRFLKSVHVSTVKFKGKGINPTGIKVHGPFTLNANSMFKSNGEVFIAKEKVGGSGKKKKNDDGDEDGDAKTESTKWKKEGLQHLPLAIEEFNLAVFLTMVGPYVFQAQKGIAPDKWHGHSTRNDCRENIRYLVQTQIHTAAAGTAFGAKLEPQYKTKSYGNVVGIGSTVTDECNIHLCAMLFLAHGLNACLSLGRRDGIKKAREFIAMIARTRYDNDLNDKEFMDILGECLQRIFLRDTI